MEKQLNHHNLSSELSRRMDRISLRDQLIGLQEDCSSDEAESPNPQGQLLFEHLERDLPYSREPLADKACKCLNRTPSPVEIRRK